jgi:putative ABC transport system ATP-binding protein
VRASQVGFVFQSFHLIPALTALENVMLPLELAGRPEARREARAALGEVGLGRASATIPASCRAGSASA